MTEVMVSFDGGPWRYAHYDEEIEWLPNRDAFAAEAHGIRIPVLALSGVGSPPLVVRFASPFVLATPDGSEMEGRVRDVSGTWSSRFWEIEIKGQLVKTTPLELPAACAHDETADVSRHDTARPTVLCLDCGHTWEVEQ